MKVELLPPRHSGGCLLNHQKVKLSAPPAKAGLLVLARLALARFAATWSSSPRVYDTNLSAASSARR